MDVLSVNSQLLEDSFSSVLSSWLVFTSIPHPHSPHLKCSPWTGFFQCRHLSDPHVFPNYPNASRLDVEAASWNAGLLSLRSQIWSHLGSPACNGKTEVWFPRAFMTHHTAFYSHPAWDSPTSHSHPVERKNTLNHIQRAVMGKTMGLVQIYEPSLLKMKPKEAKLCALKG